MMHRLSILVAGALIVGACGGQPTANVAADLHEWGIDTSASRVAPGPVTVTVANTGELPHTLVVTAADGRVVGAGSLLRPGEAGELTVVLDPGVYDLTCRIVVEVDGSIVDHFENGMAARVTAG